MTLLIIGGTGVLSTAVVNEAINKGIAVTLINRGHHIENIPNGVELIKSDIHDEIFIRQSLEGRMFDCAIDFICYDKAQISYSVNLLKDFCKQYIFISSAAVYDTSLPGRKRESDQKILKTWDYSINKWECEEFLRSEAEKLSLAYTIVRPCVTYDNTRIPYGFMPPYGYHWTIVARAINGKPVVTWDGGNAKCSIMRVEDFACAMVGLIGNEAAFGKEVNVCGDVAYSWIDIINRLSAILGIDIHIFDVSSNKLQKVFYSRAGEISGRASNSDIDNSLLKELVPDYHERISIEEGMRLTVEAYKANGYQKGIDWMYDALCDRITHNHFCNYLGNATVKDRLRYLKHRYCK